MYLLHACIYGHEGDIVLCEEINDIVRVDVGSYN